jgi:hypothetical protein
MCQCMSTMARLKKMVTLTLDPKLLERLAAWMERQEIPPQKNQVVELALREFLDRRERKGKS